MRHAQGSRVLQATLKALPAAAAAALVAELEGSVGLAAADVHGSWSVAAAYERTRAPFILREISADLVGLASLPHAGRVVQAVLVAAAAHELDLAPAVASLLRADVAALGRHPFANYAVQLALKHAPDGAQRAALHAALLPQLLELATSKHGSATAETLLALADAPTLRAAAALALAPGALPRLCDCNYGNYVLQRLIKLSAPNERAALLDGVRRASAGSTFGRIVLSRLGEPEM